MGVFEAIGGEGREGSKKNVGQATQLQPDTPQLDPTNTLLTLLTPHTTLHFPSPRMMKIASLKRYAKYLPRYSSSHYSSSQYYSSSTSSEFPFSNASTPILFGFLGCLALGIQKITSCEQNNEISENAPGVQSNMPIISRAEVTRHKTVETRIWTTFKNGH
jgi:hypothetical protein